MFDDPLPNYTHWPVYLYRITHTPHHTHTTPTHTLFGLVPLLGEQVAGETLLPLLVPGELQVHYGPALVARHPDGTDVGELCEAVREVLEVVASDIEDGERGEG